MPTHANPCGAATTWVVWANTWKKHQLWFLRYTLKKFFLLYSSARAEPAHVYGFWRSIRHTTCFHPRMCLLGVSFILLPILGVKSPKTPILGAWIGTFKLNVQNIKICILSKLLRQLQPILHSHKDHQILYVGGPNTRKTNLRWRTAAILKNRNWPYLWNGSTDLREIWHDDAYWVSKLDQQLKFPTFENLRWKWKIENRPYLRIGSTDLRVIRQDDAYWASELDAEISNFYKSKMATAAILKNGKSAIEHYLSMQRPVRVKSAIRRVGKSKIICYVIYFTYFTK